MGSARPLISFILLAYNQERYIAEAVKGALAQTYEPLEIILSDDCSLDRTFQWMQAAAADYDGPHRVTVRQNEQNLGLAGHLNRLMEMTSGELVVGAAGDDVSLPQRVERIYTAFEASRRRAFSIYSNACIIDESGHKLALLAKPPKEHELSLEWFASRQASVIGATHAWHRKIFEYFGRMDDLVIHEDLVLPFRAALLGEVHYIDEPLVLYRRHAANLHFDFNHKDELSAERMYTNIARYNRAYAAIYQTRLRDLECAREQLDSALYERLVSTTRRMQREVDDEYLLLNAGTVRRIQVMLRALQKGTPPRRVARWILTYFFPLIYLRYLGYAGRRGRQAL